MSIWNTYPSDYRSAETHTILAAVRAGECVSVVGLSGAGKSNLLGFMAHRCSTAECRLVLVDCNRLSERTPAVFFRLIRQQLGDGGDWGNIGNEFEAMDAAMERQLSNSDASSSICLLFDRFDALPVETEAVLSNNLRALRDAHKFQLTFATGTRLPLPIETELGELFQAHVLWLGPLSESDARWNVARYAERKQQRWDDATAERLITVSGRYPAFLRAACEAYADGIELEVKSLLAHPGVQARLKEFWSDSPSDDDLRRFRLADNPLLTAARPPSFDTTQLTAKEHLLLNYFLAHPEVICEKDDLIRAVWPEDRVFERGVRDDSLAQLMRRLREKIEPDPSNPRYIHTVPGRGYRFVLSRG